MLVAATIAAACGCRSASTPAATGLKNLTLVELMNVDVLSVSRNPAKQHRGGGTLPALEWEPRVTAAGVYDKQGNRFAEYVRADHSRGLPTSPSSDGHDFEAGALTLFRPIALDRKRIGTIYLEAPLKRLHDRIQHLAAVAALVLAGSLLVAGAVLRRLQTSITGPLDDLGFYWLAVNRTVVHS